MTRAPHANPKVRPSAWWYALVPLVFCGGVALGIAAAVSEGLSVADSFERVGPDGRASIELAQGDEASLFALWEDGRSSEGLSRPPVRVTVTGPDGDDVPFGPAGGGRTTFESGGDAGIDLGSFTARVDGVHEVEVDFELPAGVPEPEAAVGRLDLSAIVRETVRPIAIGAVASLAIFVLLLVLRGQSKRRIRRGQPGTPPQPPSPGSQGPITFN